MTLGERLQQFRRDRGLSQEEVAQRLFLSRQSVSKWENDQAEPGVEHLKALAGLYGVTVDRLIGNFPEEPEEPPTGLLEGILAFRVALTMLSFFFLNGGIIFCLGLLALAAAFYCRNRTLWLITLILEGVSLFFSAVIAIREFWYQGMGQAIHFAVMVTALAVELAVLLHPRVKRYCCKE